MLAERCLVSEKANVIICHLRWLDSYMLATDPPILNKCIIYLAIQQINRGRSLSDVLQLSLTELKYTDVYTASLYLLTCHCPQLNQMTVCCI